MTTLHPFAAEGTESDAHQLRCVPNSIFVFSILVGHPMIDPGELNNIPSSAHGSSFLDLRLAATKVGLQTEIRKYKPQDYDSLPLPAIVQLKNYNNSLVPYHFNVIYKIDSGHIYMLDGTTGFKLAFRRSRFSNFWTGYAMIQGGIFNNWGMNQVPRSVLMLSLVLFDIAVVYPFDVWLRRRGVRIEDMHQMTCIL